jgi:kynurenine formamidase
MTSDRLGSYRIVDLSTRVDPTTSKRLCRIKRFYQESTKDYHSHVEIESHLGTHVETPYHYKDAWKDILDRADKGRVREGDIVVLTSDYHTEPFSGAADDRRPYLTRESGEWFAEKRVKCIGFGDGVAIEHSVKDACDIHEVVMRRDILFLEVLRNIDDIGPDIFFMSYMPMPIKGLDSCCVRAFAIEGIPEFCE